MFWSCKFARPTKRRLSNTAEASRACENCSRSRVRPIRNSRPERDSLEFAVISGEVEEVVRERWYQTIPEQYRAREEGESRSDSNRHLLSDLMLPPSPKPILDKFFQRFERHLTQDQLRARNKFVSNRVERAPAAPPPSKRKRAKPSLALPSELPATASN